MAMWLSQVHKKQLVHWTSCKCTMLHQLIFANKIYLLCCPLILEHNKAMHITALTERRCTLHVWRRYRAHLLSSMESFSQGRFVYSVTIQWAHPQLVHHVPTNHNANIQWAHPQLVHHVPTNHNANIRPRLIPHCSWLVSHGRNSKPFPLARPRRVNPKLPFRWFQCQSDVLLRFPHCWSPILNHWDSTSYWRGW